MEPIKNMPKVKFQNLMPYKKQGKPYVTLSKAPDPSFHATIEKDGTAKVWDAKNQKVEISKPAKPDKFWKKKI